MTLFEAVYSRITGDATLGPALTGCYPQFIPPGSVFPFAMVRRISGGTALTSHDGDDGLNPIRIEVTIWDDDVKRMEQLSSRVRSIFRFTGLLGGVGGVRVAFGAFSGPRSVIDPETRAQGLQLDILGLLDESTVV